MQKFRFFLFCTALCFVCSGVLAQRNRSLTPENQKEVKKDANLSYTIGDYESALNGYLDLFNANKKPVNHYKIAYCYLHTNRGKSKAIPFLEYVLKQPDAPKEAWFYMGLAQHYANKFDEAIKYYEKYKEVTGDKPDPHLMVDRQIAMAKNGKELVKRPLNVKFESLGKSVNSIYPDYNPFITLDDSLLVFTSKRQGNSGGVVDEFGKYPADVYLAVKTGSVFSKAKNAGVAINTEWDEEAVGISADGKTLFAYFDNADVFGDIICSKVKGKSWQKAYLLGLNINTKSNETGATMTTDENVLYFASDREGGIGGKDIYKSSLLPNGDWGIPVNLGPSINTPFDEDAPFIHADGKTLFFSSKGYNSMGGYDIFRSTWDPDLQVWTRPENIGYPVNTADDNLFFSITGDYRYGYISAYREGGMGDLDIYRLTFKDVISPSNLTIVRGYTLTQDSTPIASATIHLTDKTSNEKISFYKSGSKGNFLMILSPGTYTLQIEEDGFISFTEDLLIPEVRQRAEMTKKLILRRK